MKTLSSLLLMTALWAACPLLAQQLLWAEEFSGEELDTTVWSFELGDGCPALCGWGNNELQAYTRQNHRVADGYLTITARKGNEGYTSARVTTKHKKTFQYGRVEARISLPSGAGLWPAFWMLGANIDSEGWPACGEIDIMEYVGREPGRFFTSLHTSSSHGNTQNTRTTLVPGAEEGFHIFAAEWSPGEIAFFIDGQRAYTYAPNHKTAENWPFDQPFYLLANLAVGGNFGGPHIDDSAFPQSFIIDYIRVYSLE